MTSHVVRLYALATALVLFFLTWAAVAARPWATRSKRVDPALQALVARSERLRRESLVVRRVVAHRWAVYRVELRHRRAQIAAREAQIAAARIAQQLASAPSAAGAGPVAAPSVRVVSLPPVTITRTS